jgi:hypothetical protein
VVQTLHILAVCPLASVSASGDILEPRDRVKVHVVSMVNRMEVNNSLLRLAEYIKQFYARWKRYSSPGAPPPNCRHSLLELLHGKV